MPGHTGIYATSAEIVAKLGKHYDTGFTEAMINAACLQTESLINVLCKKVFAVDAAAFTALPASTKYLLSEVSACLVAIYGIEYNMAGLPATPFTSRVEAESMINILRDAALRGLSVLRDKKNQDFFMSP